jgi:hypothetical protein
MINNPPQSERRFDPEMTMKLSSDRHPEELSEGTNSKDKELSSAENEHELDM